MNKKGALLLAGAAAYAYYRYSKMSEQEKSELKAKLNDAGNRIMDNLPSDLKNVFSKGETTAATVVDEYKNKSF